MRKLGIGERVALVSGRDDMPALLQAADLMICPASARDGGVVVLEAIVAGLPVVTTSLCDAATYTCESGAGIVLDEPFSQSRFNEVLADALADAPQRAAWSDHGVDFGIRHPGLYEMPARALDIIDAYVAGRDAVE